MDKELIFYLIFGLIYLLSRIGKKKKKIKAPPTAPQKQSNPPSRPVPAQPQVSTPPRQESEEAAPMSFEDILRELSGEGRKKRQQPVEPEPVKIPEPQKKKPLVSEPASEVPLETFDKSVAERSTEASDLWTAYKTKGKETSEDANLWGADKGEQLATHTTFDPEETGKKRATKFEVYEKTVEENPLAGEIREMLEDKEDVKKAILLAEILQRKY